MRGSVEEDEFRRLWDELIPIGRAESGGYERYSWTGAELACREWFREQADRRGLKVTEDGNGNLAAWWAAPQAVDHVLTGSHFDSVPGGGAFDGPLGIASAFLAVDLLRRDGYEPRNRSIGIAAFVEEEGARFGVPCLGTRLATGALDPDAARALTDRDGTTLAAAMTEAGADPAALGPDRTLQDLACFVELHIEQGRALDDQDAPVGVATGIWPHGRWRMRFSGAGDHAGTTLLADRRDPMLTFAFAVLAARKEARLAGAHATVGRVEVHPGATNAVPDSVDAWLDVRAADEATVNLVLEGVESKVRERAGRDGTGFEIAVESFSGAVEFDPDLRERLRDVLGGVPAIPTAAGHDAGIINGHARHGTAMLFVRNPTGVSHAPREHASDADCVAGVTALAAVLKELTS
ncbi:allantoate amidohydrolase [Glycomyces salinus]|uniref:allantoate amidohydrolase n=1 Tax=Glycomyces salinus TaxID=980294 RepID=UPI0018EDB631|nr:allantoate amidohydrolase [Glycomyces salinus]